MKKLLKNTLIIFLVTLGLLVVLELMVRLFWNQKTSMVTLSEQEQGIKMDSGSFTFRFVPGTVYRRQCPEYAITYRINSEGMRDPNTYLDKPGDTAKVRILAMGDSFTFGEGSEQEDTWLSRLEQSLRIRGRKVEIIKAGVGAYDQYQEYNYLKEIIGLYKPDYVMLGFLANDLFTNKPLTEKSKPINLQKEEAGSGRSMISHLLQKYHTLSLAKHIAASNDDAYIKMYEGTDRVDYFKKPGKRSEATDKKFALTAELFRQIDSLCDANNAPLFVVSIPQLYEVIRKSGGDIDANTINDYFIPVAEKQGFRWITTISEFRDSYASGVKTHYRVDGHLTPAGNEILANTVKQKLETELQ